MFSGWFGLRKEFCPWLLDVCPMLQEYGNISYKVKDDVQNGGHQGDSSATDASSGNNRESSSNKQTGSHSRSKRHVTISGYDEQPKCMVPIVSIDMPD